MHGKFYKLLILPCRRILNLQLFFLWFFLHLRILRLCKYIQIENNPWLWKLKHIRKFSKKKFLNFTLKGVFAKNERGYRLNATKKRFWSLLILLLSVASIRRKLLKTSHTEERSAHTNWENCNIRLRP